MKLVVQDASVLIDLAAADLLDAWFGLGIETLTSSLVWREVTRRSQKTKLRGFARNRRLKIVGIGTEVMSQIFRLRMDLSAQLSLKDVSVLHLASDRGAILLTGDRRLRTAAETHEVTVYSLPALMDFMVGKRALSTNTAIAKLALLCRLNPRLPKQECELLVSKWRNA